MFGAEPGVPFQYLKGNRFTILGNEAESSSLNARILILTKARVCARKGAKQRSGPRFVYLASKDLSHLR